METTTALDIWKRSTTKNSLVDETYIGYGTLHPTATLENLILQRKSGGEGGGMSETCPETDQDAALQEFAPL